MGIGCPETSVTNYQSTLCNIPEEQISAMFIVASSAKYYSKDADCPYRCSEVRKNTSFVIFPHTGFYNRNCLIIGKINIQSSAALQVEAICREFLETTGGIKLNFMANY
jgi:late competence protein required for DNA uptake (superfamily II DNA/RNA helicase)